MLRALCSIALVFAVGCGDNIPFSDDDVPMGPQCGDGVDNDGDGAIDFPNDPGCDSGIDETEDSQALPKCSDNRDNDNDGLVDFPNDPGCLNPQEDDESDDCPDGPECPACANGIDDDVSGGMDFPGDPGCESAGDDTEFSTNPVACGAGMTIAILPASGTVTANLDGTSTSSLATKCGGGGGASGHAYALVLTEPKIVVASTVNETTTIDTVIDIRRANCSETDAHVTCNDDERTGVLASEVTVSLDPGVYYIIVEGHDTSVTGPYQLTVQQFSSEGAECTMQSDCAPGLVCRIPAGETAMVCAQPVCNDGADDDDDDVADFPNDPGCESPSDNDEADDCPDGPNCPACSNDEDDDNDGLTDFPTDLGCGAAGSNIEGCGTEQDPILAIGGPTTTGDTTGAHDDFKATCSSTGGLDLQYTLTLPDMKTLTIDTVGSSFDTVIALRASTCDGQIACNDDGASPQSRLTVTDLDAGLYVVAVDGFDDEDLGAFTVNVTGEIAVGGSCEGGLFASGAIACEAGASCIGDLGSRTCETECSDGIDNNGDGTLDFPNDPACTSLSDSDEEDIACPGPMCPACADGADNDGDGDTDFPDDVSCNSASDVSEEDCQSTEGIQAITTPNTAGTTTGQTDDLFPECAGSTSGPDLHFSLDLPALESLQIVLTPESGFDSVLVFYDSTCGPAELACSDDFGDPEIISRTDVAAGRYFVAVDGFSTSELGSFTLTTSGVIAPGGSCESTLFASGVLTCAQGLPCSGEPGERTCSSDCSDGDDNDGDGLVDFPEEPGCTSIADDSETDNCPGGVDCPQCSDGDDNDGDGATDFGDDPDCLSASTASEGSQCFQTDAVVDVVSFFTNGNTTNATDDIDLSCGSSSGTGPDLAMRLELPAMSSLSLDLLVPSSFDSIHALLVQQCTQPELLCRDATTLDFGPLDAGTYFVVVDGFDSADSGVFTLLTSGEVAPGGSCEGPLFESGALICAADLPCQGEPGSRICFSECSDGVDNSGDGLIDFPNDPGCTGDTDLVEDDVCPGPNCPACSNETDDDGDGLVDFPDDFACASAASTTEQFCPIETDPIGAISLPVTTGTLDGTVTDNYEQTCQGSTGPDVAFQLLLPVPVTSLQIDTIGSTISDTVVSVKDAACGAVLGCDDDGDPDSARSLLRLSNVAAGAYAIQVDSFGSNTGAFTLNVKGTVAEGTACDSPLFAAGVLVCAAGSTCNGTVCD